MTESQLPTDDDGLDDLLRDAVMALREPVPARVSAIQAVKAAVRDSTLSLDHARAPRLAPAAFGWRWLSTRQTVRLSPLAALAASLLLVVGVSALTARLLKRDALIAARAAMPVSDAQTRLVRFTLSAPTAKHVALVGDFNNWDPVATALRERDGTWTVFIRVTPGRHQYGFVVDGSTWIADPTAPRSPETDFGSANSVVYISS